jgi:hypothetical protein
MKCMIMNSKIGRILEAAITYFKVVSQHLRGEAKEDHENLCHSRKLYVRK